MSVGRILTESVDHIAALGDAAPEHRGPYRHAAQTLLAMLRFCAWEADCPQSLRDELAKIEAADKCEQAADRALAKINLATGAVR